MNKRTIILVIVVPAVLVGLAVVGVVGWLVFGDAVQNTVHGRSFDSEIWKNLDEHTEDSLWPPRLCMVDDLMGSGRLDNLSKAQVVDLLGPPHDRSFPFGATDCDIHYYLGPERGFTRIDGEWLFLKFDQAGKVQRYWLYRD